MTQVLKVREVMQLLQAGNKVNLVVCTYDKNRPEKSGKRILLKNVVYSSSNGFLHCNVRLPNSELQSIHPCLIEKYNGTIVTP